MGSVDEWPTAKTDRRQALKEDRIAIVLLSLLVIAAFADVVFKGRSLVPSENLHPIDYRFTEELRGPDFIPPSEWQRRDLVLHANNRDITASTQQVEPARELLRKSLRAGEFPFWDPHIGAGGPSFSTLTPAFLFPPSLGVVLLGNGSLIKNIYILLLIACSGTFTYLLLRRHGLSWQGSLAGAVAFMLSGAVVQNAPSPLGQPVAFFSLPLIVTARLLDLPGARRAAQLALVFGFVALASFPPLLLQIFATCVLYVCVSLLLGKDKRLKAAGWFAAGSAVSLAVVAVAYLPAVRAMAEATHIRALYQHAAAATLEPRLVLQLLSPTIMGGADIYAQPAMVGGTGLHLYYIGVVALILAGIGSLVQSPDRGRVLKLTVLIAGFLSLAKIFGVPPVQWVIHMPGLRTIHYAAYFGVLVAYAVACLAAFGVDALTRGKARRWQIAASGAVAGLALVLLRIAAWRNGVGFRPEGWRWIADFRVLVLLSILALIFTWLATSKRRVHVAIVVILALLAIEGISNSVYPRPRRWDIWRHPPRFVTLLTELSTGGRILPMSAYGPNSQSAFGQFSIDSIANFTSPRVHAIYKRYFCPTASYFLRETTLFPPEPVLDVANVEYVAISSSRNTRIAEALRRGYEVLYSDELLNLFRRPTTPRYTFTSNYRVIASARERIEALSTLSSGVVLLERHPGFPSSTMPAVGVKPRLIRFGLNEVEIAVDTDRHGLLVCSESMMNGWVATLDGRQVPILVANHAFRAVEVPRGSHSIRFRYHAPGFKVGLITTLTGLVVCLYGLFMPAQPRPSPEP